jgi:hypothetical protein
MPGWVRRLRIMIDWTFPLLFRPDIGRLSLDSEAAWAIRDADPPLAGDEAGRSSAPIAPVQHATAEGSSAAGRA